MPESLNFSTTFKPSKFEQHVIAQIRSAITEELAEAVSTLQQASPVGATGDYKAGWSLIPARRLPSSFELQGTIRNSTEHTTYAARGWKQPRWLKTRWHDLAELPDRPS